MTLNNIATWVSLVFNLSPAVFTVFAVIVAGYVLRVFPKFPNRWIPAACVIVGEFVFCVEDERDPTMSTLRFYTRATFIGATLGFAAWAMHDKFIKQWEDRIPWLGKLLTTSDGTKQYTRKDFPADAPANQPKP